MLTVALGMSGCYPVTAADAPLEHTPPAATATMQPTLALEYPTATSPPVQPPTIWLSPELPQGVKEAFIHIDDYQVVETPAQANLTLSVLTEESTPEDILAESTWVYALAVPFPVPILRVEMRDLREAWEQGAPGREIWLTAETLEVFRAWWGDPAAEAVRVVESEGLLEQAWAEGAAWALAPFDALTPGWRVLRVDNASPFDPNFNPQRYPLSVRIGLQGENPVSDLPALPTNYERDRMTVLAMTGVTALTRRTAALMNEKGVLYPGGRIAGWLREADLTHISNEVSFNPECPPEKAAVGKALFCSSPDYIRLLELVGTDIVELTGNHNFDRGQAAYLFSLDLYRARGWGVYGGGETIAEAAAPLLVENNGNRLAFLGCNIAGPDIALASADRPGAAPCDFEALALQVRQLRDEGYLPVVSLQAYETEDYRPAPMQRPNDFVRLAEAGAVVVSGSQAHVPQGFKLAGDGLIHYGLGNLFFDQTDSRLTRRAFIDRHIFYDGRYLGVALFPVVIETYGRPTPMMPDESQTFLETIFDASNW